jgi:hypothetical protein
VTPYARVHSNPWCQARIPGVCTGRTQHAHHRQLRRPDNTVDENLLAVCGGVPAGCHEFIHAHPEWARRHGLLVSKWADYRQIPPHPGCDPDCPIDHTENQP